MDDTKLLVSAIHKLIEVFASGLGAVLSPVYDRLTAPMKAEVRRIKATGEADAQRIKAKGDAESLAIKTDAVQQAVQKITEIQEYMGLPTTAEISIGQEIGISVQIQKEKRQANIFGVVLMAAEELGEKQVPDHDVDHDWTARFFSDVQDVTSEQLQRIWAKILSGEVETPGRTSLHTLAILKNMSQRDAEMFANASRFVLNNFILLDEKHTSHLEGFPLYSDILHLQSYGLLSAGPLHTRYQLNELLQDRPCTFFPHLDMMYGILAMANQREISIPCYLLTIAGQQLYSIMSVETNESYLGSLARYLLDEKKAQLVRTPVLEMHSDGQFTFPHGQLVDVLTGDPVIPAAG